MWQIESYMDITDIETRDNMVRTFNKKINRLYLSMMKRDEFSYKWCHLK